MLTLVGWAPDLPVPEATPLHFESVLVAGDSLAGGYFASTKAAGFRGILVDTLEKGGPVELHRYGFPHGRLADIDDTLPPSGLDLAVVEIGTNDFGKTPRAEFRRGYKAYLARIEKTSSDVKLICLGLWQTSGAKSNGTAPDDYDNIIETVCEADGGTFIPLQPIFDAKDTRGPAGVTTEVGTSDAFHPNDHGHALIAAAIVDALRQ
ncbi:MAG TPA: SGNH/GDSL hydrolase family protein [Terrimesophilobacter sp.]|nr:SGNH/GDSL hydrolase family protein [Terrimesophilobacter sp.]